MLDLGLRDGHAITIEKAEAASNGTPASSNR
jgi:hypothetical protein